MIASSTTDIPGLTTRQKSDGTQVWKLKIIFQNQHKSFTFQTREEAIEYYRSEKLCQTFLHWPPLSHEEHQAMTALMTRHTSLAPILGPLFTALVKAHVPSTSAHPPRKPPTHQQGLPAKNTQTGIGGPLDPEILFQQYARRWYESQRAGWTVGTQDFTRINCTKHLIPAFGTLPLRQITATMIETWLQTLLTRYSLALCQGVRKTLASILYAAIKDGLITHNPATDSRCMLPTQATRHHLTHKELVP